MAVGITKDLSRFGRNSALTELYINFVFPQHGIRYIAINDNYDTINPPYGYIKDPENPKQWIIDEEAAQVVRHIFDLRMEGRGPTQIGSLLEKKRVPNPTTHQGKTSNYSYKWETSTVVHILERKEYTGCTVNFKTYTNSIWNKKQRKTPEDERTAFYDTPPAINHGGSV